MADITIEIGQIKDTDTDAAYIAPSVENYSWRDFKVHNYYRHNFTRYVLGVTSEEDITGDTAAFVQLSKGWLIWIADWTASMANKVPEIPDPTPSDPLWKLLSSQYQPNQLSLAADGVTPIYRITGTYVYGHRKPNPKTVLNTNFGRPPWVEDRFIRVFTEKDFVKNVIDGKGAGGNPENTPGLGPVFIR